MKPAPPNFSDGGNMAVSTGVSDRRVGGERDHPGGCGSGGEKRLSKSEYEHRVRSVLDGNETAMPRFNAEIGADRGGGRGDEVQGYDLGPIAED